MGWGFSSFGAPEQIPAADTPSLLRGIQDEELQRFCFRVSKLLQDDPGPAAVDALQRLFLIVSATKYPRR